MGRNDAVFRNLVCNYNFFSCGGSYGKLKIKKEVENDLLSRLVPMTVESCNQLKDQLIFKQLRIQYSQS
jgi:hypothetical protein